MIMTTGLAFFGRFWVSAGLVWMSKRDFGLLGLEDQGFMVIPQAGQTVLSVALKRRIFIRGELAAY